MDPGIWRKSERLRILVWCVSDYLGSAGCQPAVVGSLPTTIVFGKLPNTAGKLPALP
jgi:hypothetical protein